MRIIGITGGIGCGKSHLVEFIKALKYPVYSSDQSAKEIVNSNDEVKNQIIDLLGSEAFIDGIYNVKYVSHKVFESEDLLKELNNIIHPKVNENFHIFVSREKLRGSSLIFKESALIVETGDYRNLDYIFLVTSPLGIRKRRVLQRKGMNIDKFKRILEVQWTDLEKKNFVDTIIENDEENPFLEGFLFQLGEFLKSGH